MVSKIPPEVAVKIFGDETFIRAMDRTGAPVPETDLFAVGQSTSVHRSASNSPWRMPVIAAVR